MNATRHLGYVLKRFPRISETFVAAELIELERQGERVTVFAVTDPREPFRHRFLDELAADVVYLPHRPLRDPARVARAVGRCLRRDPGSWLAAAAACLWPPRLTGLRRLLQASVLREEVGDAGIDHAHAHFATAAARLANLAWRMGGPAYSVTAHAKDIYHRDVRVEHLRDKLGSATFVATVSEANRAHLASVLGAGAPLHVIPNSVDLRRLGGARGSRSEARRLLTVARLVEKKGLPDLVDACRLLGERDVLVQLVVVGDGPMRSSLEQRAASAGLDAVFCGALPQEEVLDRYRRAAVFCLPCVVGADGDRDGLPTSVLEAMALGVPAVTTAVGGLSELVVHERTGLVVPERDPAALAEALARVLTDRTLATALAAAARRHVEAGFSLERSAARLRSLFPEAA